jgi:hypothetical protein
MNPATGALMQAARTPDQTAMLDGSPPLPSGPPPKTNPDTYSSSAASRASTIAARINNAVIRLPRNSLNVLRRLS